MEYARSTDYVERTWQWCDSQKAMVLDLVTGEPQRFGKGMNSIGTLEDAVEYASSRTGWENRMVVVKLDCVAAFMVKP